ncbi:hypothetical protein EDD34_3752 [Myceligenerans xiligouense]|uniref:Uncharacterized protein n=1 Tax=Myceligenerans xiligouense TaxID=253184 RepID=A0A3N4ZC80_9MICO|nr:hypothetical protein EDD34_3752 [Myceligenerans xiligouense]
MNLVMKYSPIQVVFVWKLPSLGLIKMLSVVAFVKVSSAAGGSGCRLVRYEVLAVVLVFWRLSWVVFLLPMAR